MPMIAAELAIKFAGVAMKIMVFPTLRNSLKRRKVTRSRREHATEIIPIERSMATMVSVCSSVRTTIFAIATCVLV